MRRWACSSTSFFGATASLAARRLLSATSGEGPPMPEAALGVDALPTAPSRQPAPYNTPPIPTDSLAGRSGRRDPPAAVPHEPSPDAVPSSDRMASGKFRRVGNIIVLRVTEFPFKYDWELNSILRMLKLEFHGQVSVVPDEPKYRAAIFRVRHILEIEMINTDELKKMLSVPEHITFRDLAKMLPVDMCSEKNPKLQYMGFEESLSEFMHFRKHRMKDVLARDAVELRLLKERKKLKKETQQQQSKA